MIGDERSCLANWSLLRRRVLRSPTGKPELRCKLYRSIDGRWRSRWAHVMYASRKGHRANSGQRHRTTVQSAGYAQQLHYVQKPQLLAAWSAKSCAPAHAWNSCRDKYSRSTAALNTHKAPRQNELSVCNCYCVVTQGQTSPPQMRLFLSSSAHCRTPSSTLRNNRPTFAPRTSRIASR